MNGIIFALGIILICVLAYAGCRYVKESNDFSNDKKEHERLLEEITELEQTKKKLEETLYNKFQDADNLLKAHEEGCRKSYAEFEEETERKKVSLKEKYSAAEAAYRNHYLELMEESANDFSFTIDKYHNSVNELQESLDKLKASYSAGIESMKREQEEKSKRDYYRWQLPENIIEDIGYLKEMKVRLSDPSIVDKVLWKAYYEKATNELISRVIGNSNPCGIYKITDLLDKRVYIGQSNDVKARLKQHVKSGVGAVPATNNKLYTAMKKDGLWNFTWEVIEECPREKLNEREAFWIDFYDAAGYGLNGQRGNNI